MELWRYGSQIAWHLSTRLRMARLSTKPSGIQPTKAFLQVAQPINLSESGIPGLEKMSRRSMHIQMMSWVSILTSMRILSRRHLLTTLSKFLIYVPTWTSHWWCWWVTSLLFEKLSSRPIMRISLRAQAMTWVSWFGTATLNRKSTSLSIILSLSQG